MNAPKMIALIKLSWSSISEADISFISAEVEPTTQMISTGEVQVCQ